MNGESSERSSSMSDRPVPNEQHRESHSLKHAQKCIKNLANHGILGIAGKLLKRRAKLLHLIKANL